MPWAQQATRGVRDPALRGGGARSAMDHAPSAPERPASRAAPARSSPSAPGWCSRHPRAASPAPRRPSPSPPGSRRTRRGRRRGVQTVLRPRFPRRPPGPPPPSRDRNPGASRRRPREVTARDRAQELEAGEAGGRGTSAAGLSQRTPRERSLIPRPASRAGGVRGAPPRPGLDGLPAARGRRPRTSSGAAGGPELAREGATLTSGSPLTTVTTRADARRSRRRRIPGDLAAGASRVAGSGPLSPPVEYTRRASARAPWPPSITRRPGGPKPHAKSLGRR